MGSKIEKAQGGTSPGTRGGAEASVRRKKVKKWLFGFVFGVQLDSPSRKKAGKCVHHIEVLFLACPLSGSFAFNFLGIYAATNYCSFTGIFNYRQNLYFENNKSLITFD